MIVWFGHQAHAVAEANATGAAGDGAVQHFRIGAMREFRQEVMLDGPHRIPTETLAGDGLLERILVGAMLTVTVPGRGNRNLIEQSELHRGRSPCVEWVTCHARP